MAESERKTMLWDATAFLSSVTPGRCVILLFISYFIGCFTAGYYLVRWRTRQDVRALGSGNVGARNVGRILGKSGFVLTLLFDFAKGAFAVWLARWLAADERVVSLAVIAVVAGHIWPVQLNFRGGKGVATFLGALLFWNFLFCIPFAAMFTVFFLVLRKTTLSGLIAFGLLPIAALWFTREPVTVFALATTVALLLFAHRKNLLQELSTLLVARRGVRAETKTSN